MDEAVTIVIEDERAPSCAREVYLTNGMVALVDSEDYEEIRRFSWTAYKGGRTWYAVRSERLGDGSWHTIRMHRQIANPQEGEVVDHVDRDGLNNQRRNLRCTNWRGNSRNRVVPPGGSSQYRGVRRSRGKWRSTIKANGRTINVGVFATEVEAAIGYDNAAMIYHGEYSVLNFPDRGFLS